MAERTTIIDASVGEPTVKAPPALAQFSYSNGYVFRGTDMGTCGVKIELLDKYDEGAAIILPPAEAEQCAKWLLETIGQQKCKLPNGLPEVLEKIAEDQRSRPGLSRGDKRKIKQALRVLKESA